jgi:anaerobic magnesium-protoporphyrin IX monomethyl ester cyclase
MESWPPVSIMSIAGVLKEAGIPVEIVDFHVLWNEREQQALEHILNSDDFLMVGISTMTVEVRCALRLLHLIKGKMPHVYTILGGIHPCLYPEDTCKHPLVDFVCLGEGEYTTLELVNHLEGRGPSSLDEIPGLVWKRDGQVVINEARPWNDLDKLPFLPYDLVDMDEYIHRTINPLEPDKVRRFFHVHAGQGCVFRCAFCVNTLEGLKNRGHRAKSAERLLDEIEYFMNEYGAEHIWFVDELFFLNRKRLRRFLDGIRERGLKFTWFANVRADFFKETFLNEAMLAQLEEKGLTWVSIGAESGSNRMLKLIRKDITVEQTLHAASALAKTRIVCGYSLMIGLPTETMEEIRATYRLTREIREINPNSYFYGPLPFRPYPGSPLHRICVEQGLPEYKTLDEWAANDSVATGFCSVEDCKWVQDPIVLSPMFHFYGMLANGLVYPGGSRLVIAMQRLLRPIARWRFETGFFTFPVEYLVVQQLKPWLRRRLFPKYFSRLQKN